METEIVCFGELLLRLTAPGRERLLQSPQLAVHPGGAEANVAVSLARFGHRSSMVSVLPDNPLGHACLGELRRHGVDVDGIRFGTARMGLYFLAAGCGYRPSEILYDRADSAFALASPDLIDWNSVLAGTRWLHVSGITPAIAPRAAEASLRAVKAARALGVSVSFDCNYRAKLWERWGGDPAGGLRQLAELAQLLFADERALGLILGQEFSGGTPTDRFRRAAEQAVAAFPQLQRVAATARVEHSVDHHEMSALMLSRDGFCTTRTYSMMSIVDRIGTGDAFAAGVLHGLLTDLEERAALEFGMAAACLKHSIPGDFNLIGATDVHNLLARKGYSIRR